jgi:hypothetical protein
MAKGAGSAFYYAKPSDCQPCPLKGACCGKRRYKSLSITVFGNAYQRMLTRQQSPQGTRMKKLRSARVEPVFGSLLNYYGLRRANARGKSAAHKRMLLAATAYNLQKYLAFKGHPLSPALALSYTSNKANFFSS